MAKKPVKRPKLSDYIFTFNLGRERHQRLFYKSLHESKKQKKKISIGELIRESIDCHYEK